MKRIQENCPLCGAPIDYPDIEGQDVVIRCSNPECNYSERLEGEANVEEEDI